MRATLLVALLLAVIAVASAETFYKETFDSQQTAADSSDCDCSSSSD